MHMRGRENWEEIIVNVEINQVYEKDGEQDIKQDYR